MWHNPAHVDSLDSISSIREGAEICFVGACPQRADPAKVSWECQEELFRQEVENADNIMLNYVLIRKCMGDKKKFCGDIKPGAALHVSSKSGLARTAGNSCGWARISPSWPSNVPGGCSHTRLRALPLFIV